MERSINCRKKEDIINKVKRYRLFDVIFSINTESESTIFDSSILMVIMGIVTNFSMMLATMEAHMRPSTSSRRL
jgi:hypothetical protein